MFGGRFSLTKFSLRTVESEETDVNVSGYFAVAVQTNSRGGANVRTAAAITYSVQASAAIAADFLIRSDGRELIGTVPVTAVTNTELSHAFSGEISAAVKANIDFAEVLNCKEEISATSGMIAAVVITQNFTAGIDGDIAVSNFVSVSIPFRESVEGLLRGVYNTGFGHDFRDSIETEITSGTESGLSADFRESVFMMSQANELESESMIIDIRIPPGGTLIIDSEKFIVTLDGENIIHLHSGDFVNISRDTIDMLISSDGALTGELVYVERYL